MSYHEVSIRKEYKARCTYRDCAWTAETDTYSYNGTAEHVIRTAAIKHIEDEYAHTVEITEKTVVTR